MKKIPLFLFIFVLSSPTHANLSELMIKNHQKLEANKSPEFCAPNTMPSDHGLMLEISCRFQCVGKEEKFQHMNVPYIPQDLGLSEGNGSNGEVKIWRGLTASLKWFSQKNCQSVAIDSCGSWDQVEKTQVALIKSGKWSLSSFPDCSLKSIIESPFSDTSGARRLEGYQTKIKPESTGKNEEELNSVIEKIVVDPSICLHPVRAELCVGDCVSEDEKTNLWIESLGSADPGAKVSVVVCMDQLLDFFKKQKIESESLKIQLCEEVFWRGLIRKSKVDGNCAAARGSVDCSHLLK